MKHFKINFRYWNPYKNITWHKRIDLSVKEKRLCIDVGLICIEIKIIAQF